MTNQMADLRVMLSYARADAGAFSHELADALEAANFDVLIDVDDIEAAEDWQDRLSQLIRSVDTLIVVLTPAWVSSEICRWELDEAFRQNKRVIPLILREPTDPGPPPELSKLNYIFFDGRQTFGAALKQLAPALRVNLGWIRDHTHYSESARLWEARSRDPAMLLRGAELGRAKDWLASREPQFPEISVSVSEFITASAEYELQQAAERKRSSSWIIAVFLIVPICLAATQGYGLWLNLERIGKIDESDLTALGELIVWMLFTENLGYGTIILAVLFGLGGAWLSRNLSTRMIAGIFASLVVLAGVSVVSLDALAQKLVFQSRELDTKAASNNFKVEPCAPSVRRLMDRYRAPPGGPKAPRNHKKCDKSNEDYGEVINRFRQRVLFIEYLPFFVLLGLPLLYILFRRLVLRKGPRQRL